MTLEQFKALPRYPNGRLLDLPAVFHLITDEMLAELHGDDWSYYHELQEELEYLMAEFRG